MNKIFLISNAHLDPVWQWEWEEGVGAALSTFRAAASFCEQYDEFVFCHNEVLLYKWIEEHEPVLFQRIKKLVAAGKWHIMGGWYLQPDCNMPSGESMVRQIEAGRRYFYDHFGAKPTVAINFDPFGHSKGLVQIMQRAGYQGYIICRPPQPWPDMQGREDFLWEGLDGSQVMVHRSDGFYASSVGHAVDKIKGYLDAETVDQRECRLVLWGVGNHGGGPSRKDIEDIAALKAERTDKEILHSTPEQYFEAAKAQFTLKYDKTLSTCMQGCYTSQVRVKQKHRALENVLYTTEKMCSHAAMQGFMEYPQNEISAAQEDLLFAQFHDILPGSSTQPVEEMAMRLMDHGLEELSRLKARAFFAMTTGEEKVKPGEHPILIYNPHPFPVDTLITAEFMLAYQNDGKGWQLPTLFLGEQEIPVQLEKEESNIPLDWRKRVTFRAQLAPMSMTRYSCYTNGGSVAERVKADNGFVFDNGEMRAVFNADGQLSSLVIQGKEYLSSGVHIAAFADCEDSWGYGNGRMDQKIGEFRLVSNARAVSITGVKNDKLGPFHVVEDGPVRTVLEGIYEFDQSWATIRYSLPKVGHEISLSIRIMNDHRQTLFKLVVPTVLQDTSFEGKTMFGVEHHAIDGSEVVAQEWIRCSGAGYTVALANNGVYGASCTGGTLAQSLLRSSGYCAHPVGDPVILPQDRFSPHAEAGERTFEFVLAAGETASLERSIDRIAAVLNARPMVVSFCPQGEGPRATSFLEIKGDATLSAVKPAKNGGYILRLFNPVSTSITAGVVLADAQAEFQLRPMEILTLLYKDGTITPTDLIDM